MASDLINRYLWLIDIIISSGSHGLTLAEISRKCENRYGEPYSRRTFLNHKNKIEEIFGIPVSCNPSTLARDVLLFSGFGYELKAATAFDMFPGTAHVETVVLLSKGEISSRRVRVDFSLENLDTTFLRGEATYEQIKAHVLEQTGLKVSTLYISQIKRKYGLEVGESYNKPKSEDARQPQCPPEKEAAITDALKHFGII